MRLRWVLVALLVLGLAPAARADETRATARLGTALEAVGPESVRWLTYLLTEDRVVDVPERRAALRDAWIRAIASSARHREPWDVRTESFYALRARLETDTRTLFRAPPDLLLEIRCALLNLHPR